MPRIDALQKYRNQLLSAFDAEQLQYLKYDNWTGLLTETDRLYATMFHDWDVLQKDCSDLAEAVQTLEWTVAPYVADGAEADSKAQEVAKTVTDALWKRTPRKPGTYSHTFTQLLGALVHGLFRGYNVHEIEWVNDGDMVYPAAFHQLPPQFMQWETRAGQVDRLLFVADGETDEPKPFPEHKFIVALNTSGPDHPLFNATYYSLIAWYGAYKFGLGWFMEYCQRYGLPKLVFHYESDRDRQQLEADLAEERVLNNILLKGDRAVDIANAPASGASLPQRELLNIAESQCHKLILGQTLTSDTSEHGGSLAQAKVHAGVQADIVKKRADFVADVLNSQLIPAIVLLNYGTLDVPMPELRYKIPQEGVTLERVQVVKTALEIQGMKLKKSEVYDFTGFAQPAEGDDVFEAASMGGDMGGLGALLGGKTPKKGQQDDTDPDDDPNKPKKKAPAQEREDVEPVSAAKADAPTDPAQEWLAPIKQKFLEARKNGASMADLKKMLLSMHPDTKALATAFANNILAGFAGESEKVDAANAGESESSRRRAKPIELPDGTKCYTENCERHEDNARQTNNNIVEYAQDDNSRTGGRSEEKRAGGAVQRAGQASSHSEQGGDKEVERQLGQRVLLSEAISRVVQESARAYGFDEEAAKKYLIYPAVAQLQAVEDGRKPAYLETLPEMMQGFSELIPNNSELRYVACNTSDCIYNTSAVKSVISYTGGNSGLDNKVRELVDSGHCGRILGYGYDQFEMPPGFNVMVSCGDEEISGFVVPPDISKAEAIANERLEDYKRAFPNMEWSYRIKEKKL